MKIKTMCKGILLSAVFTTANLSPSSVAGSFTDHSHVVPVDNAVPVTIAAPLSADKAQEREAIIRLIQHNAAPGLEM